VHRDQTNPAVQVEARFVWASPNEFFYSFVEI
jgi:hypothetical protein